MPFNTDAQINTGLYVATTDVWEVSRIEQVDVTSDEFKTLLVRLYQNINNIALALNLKESAYYIQEQFVNGQQFFPATTDTGAPYRAAYRLVVNIGALPLGVKSVAHGMTITDAWTFTCIYGEASDQVLHNYYPIPFAGAAGSYISLRVDNTNVVIDNNSGVTFNECKTVLEFLKN